MSSTYIKFIWDSSLYFNNMLFVKLMSHVSNLGHEGEGHDLFHADIFVISKMEKILI